MAQKKWRDISRRFAETVGDGATTVFPIAHGMGTRDVMVSVVATGAGFANLATGYTWAATDENTVTVTFSVAPTADQYRVVVIGA